MATSRIKIKKVCEYCGQEFYAQKLSTRFCSKQCSEHSYKQRMREQQVATAVSAMEQKPILSVKTKDYLSVKEASVVIGLSVRATYDLIYKGILQASKLSSRMTIIKRCSIDAMLEGRDYTKKVKPASEPITEFYTTQEVMDKFNVSAGWVFKVAKEKSIPKVFLRGKTYWSKQHIDKHLTKQQDDSITEWYSVPEMMEKFGMTTSAVYCFVSKFAIPKKKIKREVFYSKKHVDIAKGLVEPEKPQYYTVKEATEKYQITRDALYHYCKRYNIPKIQEGKYVKISKKELDEVLAPPVI